MTVVSATQVDEPSPPGLRHAVLARVVAHIDARLAERIQLAQLAKVAALSRFHFARLFRRSTGLSPMQFVACQRVRRAQWHLDQGEACIADLAVALGFFDQSHFTRTFRRVVGISPSRYAMLRRDLRRHAAAAPTRAAPTPSAFRPAPRPSPA